MRARGAGLCVLLAGASLAPRLGAQAGAEPAPPPPAPAPSATAPPGPAPQPYPGPAQPYPAQPYPAQPYPAQPYPAQPYPAQPYPAQPYPAPQPYYAPQPYPAPQPARPAPKPEPDNPAAHEGFQMALRVGFGSPFGDATGESEDTQRGRYSQQLAWEIALGGKPSRSLYLGAYAGWWVGSEGDDPYVSALCDGGDGTEVECDSSSTRIGVEVQYHFVPDGLVNPWLGYGIAYEWATESIEDQIARRTEHSRLHGFQLGRLQVGLDFRLSKVVGLGPYFLVELGRYTRTTTEIYGRESHSGDVESPAVHGWYGSGLRLVFFP